MLYATERPYLWSAVDDSTALFGYGPSRLVHFGLLVRNREDQWGSLVGWSYSPSKGLRLHVEHPALSARDVLIWPARECVIATPWAPAPRERTVSR